MIAPPQMPESGSPPSPASKSRLLARQGTGFLVVGVIQLLVDWGVFVAVSAFGVPVSASNLVGRASGAILGFWLNGSYTFRSADGRRATGWGNGGKFLVTWVVMSLLSTLCVAYVDQLVGLRWAWVGKPLIDGLLAALGFLLARNWVFR